MARTIEDFLEEWINKKYATRVIQRLNTEHERRVMQSGGDPTREEYEWMRDRARELLAGVTQGDGDEKKPKNKV
jgi:hypothetical protein